MELEKLICSVCGAPLDPAETKNGVLRCGSCNQPYTVPKADTEATARDYIINGKQELALCRFDEAFTLFKSASELDPDEPEAYFCMALAGARIRFIKDHEKSRLQPIFHDISAERFTDDPNYKRALSLANSEQKKIYIDRAKDIDLISAKLRSLKAKGADYDVFICCKITDDATGRNTDDYTSALEIYNTLKEKGLKPFFSEITLKELSGVDYEAYILYALYVSECFLLVCSNEAWLQTPWVKNEYTRFIEMTASGLKADDALTVVYNGKPISVIPGKTGAIQGIDLSKKWAGSRILDFVNMHVKPRAASSAFKFCTDCLAENDLKAKYCMNCRGSDFADTYDKAVIAGANKRAQKIIDDAKAKAQAERDRSAQKQEDKKLKQQAKQEAKRQKAEAKAKKREQKLGLSDTDGFSIDVYRSRSSAFMDNVAPKLTYLLIVLALGSAALGMCVFCFPAANGLIYENNLSVWKSITTAAFIVSGAMLVISAVAALSLSVGDSELDGSECLARIGGTFFGELAGAGAFCLFLYWAGGAKATGIVYLVFAGLATIGIILWLVKTGLSTELFSSLCALVLASFALGSAFVGLTYKSLSQPEELIYSEEYGCYYTVNKDNSLTVHPDDWTQEEFTVPAVISGRPVTAVGKPIHSKRKTALKTITVSDGVLRIGNNAFDGCYTLESVALPRSLLYINEEAFLNCKKLVSINIPDGLQRIYDSAFEGCSSLADITLNDGLTKLYDDAFKNCTSLTAINIPGTVSVIPDGAFEGCCNLTRVVVGKGIGEIEEDAFYNCSKLEYISLPDSLRKIGDDCFKNCVSLKSLYLNKDMKSCKDAFKNNPRLTIYVGWTEKWYNYADYNGAKLKFDYSRDKYRTETGLEP